MKVEAYFENIHQVILEELNNAKESIYIAVAWFTHKELFDAILKKANEKVSVNLIYLDDDINKDKLEFIKVAQTGSKVFSFPYSKGQPMMHNKFCVIDTNTVITGSYNWTYPAMKHQENIQITRNNYTLGSKYILQFWKIAENEGTQISFDKTRVIMRKKILAFLKTNMSVFNHSFSKYYPLKKKNIYDFFDILLSADSDMSSNQKITWTLELIREYEDLLDWDKIITNPTVPLTIELVREFNNHWDKHAWYEASNINRLPWTLELIRDFEDKWDWFSLSYNPSIPWTTELILAFEDKWDWEQLSCNLSIPWTLELIRKFEDRLNFDDYEGLSENPKICWTIELIRKFENKWDWSRLSENENLPWTIELIREFENKWDWWQLSSNENLPWSTELIREFENKWKWNKLSSNAFVPWTIELIREFKDNWNEKFQLQLNSKCNLPLTNHIIREFEGKWDWFFLSGNENLPWSTELIREFENKWKWHILSRNPNLPWSRELIREFEDKWDWFVLSGNLDIFWTKEIIIEFEEKLHGRSLSSNQYFPWNAELFIKYLSTVDLYELSANPKMWSTDTIQKTIDYYGSNPFLWEGIPNLPWNDAFFFDEYTDQYGSVFYRNDEKDQEAQRYFYEYLISCLDEEMVVELKRMLDLRLFKRSPY